MKNYLRISNLSDSDRLLALHNLIGDSGICDNLMHFLDDEEKSDFINWIENALIENNMKIPYATQSDIN